MLKKGVYPYGYLDSMDRFVETELPCIEKFYSELKIRHISENAYKDVKKM